MTFRPDSGGPVELLTSGTGIIQSGQVFRAEADSDRDEAIASRTKEVLARFALKVDNIRVLHPLGPALFVQATITDPTEIAGGFEGLLNAINGSPYQYEGLYVELRDSSGNVVVRGSAAYRIGHGRLWFADGADAALGIGHGVVASQLNN